jgi:uncharacterized protein (TIGR02186 family)
MKRMILFLLLLLSIGSVPRPAAAAASDLVVDLSKSLVEISTGFVGSDLLLFGAMNQPGDIVVVVRGPARQEVVRRKQKILGVWVNRAQITFGNVPTFYSISSSRKLDDVLPDHLRASYQIGYSRLILVPHNTAYKAPKVSEYREALIRNKERLGLYARNIGAVRFLGDRLFRIQILIPSTVRTGAYEIDIYLVRERAIISKKTVSFTVRKAGIEGNIFNFANQNSLAYGILAVLAAIMAGWIANVGFRRN